MTLISASRCVFVCLCAPTSYRATGPAAGNRGEVDEVRIAEGKSQRGVITLYITPTRAEQAITQFVSDISMRINTY